MNMKKLFAIMLSVLLVLGSFNVIAYGENVDATPVPVVETQAPEQQPTEVPSVPVSLNEGEEDDVAGEEASADWNEEDKPAEPTGEATAEPTGEATAEPTAEPTGEATDEPAAEPTEEATDEPTAEPTGEATAEPTAEPTGEVTDEPTPEPTAEPTEVPENGIALSLTADRLSVYAGEESIGLTAGIAGGVEPYTMTLRANGADIETKTGLTAGSYEFRHMPCEFGACRLEIIVTDAEGKTAAATTDIPVAVRETETEADWAKSVEGIALTGDWNIDLLAIALSQDGYVESQRDFIMNEYGRQGYTRYGDWFGRPYGEWCVMFVSFCLEYAEIPEEDYPRGSKSDELKSALQSRGAYEDDEHDYAPQLGDLIFFNWEQGNEPQHIGIVEEVTGTQVYTIEGNAEGRVQRKWYSIGDEAIVGYGNTRELMEIAIDKAEREAAEAEREQEKEEKGESLIVDIPEIPYEGVIGRTNAANVNVRANASTDSEILVKLAERKMQVTVLAAAADMEGVVWYAIQYGTAMGFIRADLLNIDLPEETPAPTAEPTAEPETSAEPEESAEPEATVEAEATAEPEESVEPEATVESEATTEPEVTAEPEESAQLTIEPTAQPTAEPTLTIVAQPVSAPWQEGMTIVSFSFEAEGATSYTWQQGRLDEEGDMVWTSLPESASSELMLEVTMENMKYAYRCIAADESGVSATSDAATIVAAEYVEWMNEAEVTEEMLVRAMNAKTLDSMVLEENELIHVRTGKVYARYDAATGCLIDEETGMVVAVLDVEEGMVYPIKQTAAEAEAEADEE